MAKKLNREERRRKTKEAEAQGHTVSILPPQPPAPQVQKPSLLSLLFSTAWGWFLSGVVAFTTILGFVTGIYFFMPQLSATPSTTLIESDPMSTFFIIANDGNLDLHDATFSCRVNYATDGKGIEIAMAENNVGIFRSQFPAKNKIGLPCLTAISLQHIAQGDISIQVEFRPSLWPFRKSWESRFRTQAGDNGKLYWMPEVAPFDFSALLKKSN